MYQVVKDMFMGPGNKAWDLARITGAQAFLAYSFAFLYSLVHLGQVPDWNSLGIGYTAVLGGTALLIGVKDHLHIKAMGQQIADPNAASSTQELAEDHNK